MIWTDLQFFLNRFAVKTEKIKKKKSDAGAVGPSKCFPPKSR